MKAILTKPLKSGVKTITGDVLSRGIGTITLVVFDQKGSSSIKRFKESDYVVRVF